MIVNLTLDQIHLVLKSLEYTKLKFNDYPAYPSPEFKRKQIAEVEEAIKIFRSAKKEAKD